MISESKAVTDLLPGEAALVAYTEYKKKSPILPSDRELAEKKPDARVLILHPGQAVLINYSEYDTIQLAPSG